jgi:hypothetical protein
MVAIERLLHEPQYRVAAKQWAAVFEGYDTGVLFRRFVYEALSKSPGPDAIPK